MGLPVISIAQMREWEKATWASGQTEAEVIRRVGKEVARCAMALTKPGDLVLILAGMGHNGEDACCARNHLEGRRVNVLEITDPTVALGPLEAELSLRPGLIIDGLFGIGLNRKLSPDWIELIDRVNQAQLKVLAVDTPSGLNGDSGEPEGASIRAFLTLTVGAPKQGLLKEPAWAYVGRLEVTADVGLVACNQTSELQWTLESDFAGFPLERAVATHKGTYGHLAILAGSLGYHGAAVLAARGAQRAQPGLITLYPMQEVYPVVASQLQAVMVSPWKPESSLLEGMTGLVIGPGLAAPSVPDDVKSLVRDQWNRSMLPMLVDASALVWLPAGSIATKALRVITPHPGEAARLLGSSAKEIQADRLRSLRELSQRYGNTWVVLKGHQTLIGRSSGEIYVNTTGNPHLAQGGSGDVLSGFLGGLLAQPALTAVPHKTIPYAVWQHGAAADYLQAARPNWVVEDLVEQLGRRDGRQSL
jgi:NAD(P)H-hydrate epimerase